MSRIEYGDPTWRIHDKIIDKDGNRTLIFRRWGVDHDYWVKADVFVANDVRKHAPVTTLRDIDAWTDDIVGMVEDRARVAAYKEGCVVRITMRDGVAYPVTRGYRTDRVNFNVENDIVVCASVG